jgi:putative DNA primase/helicase
MSAKQTDIDAELARIKLARMRREEPAADQRDVSDAIDEHVDDLRADIPDAEKFDGNGKGTKLPTIKVRAGALHTLATEAEQALLAAGVPLYSRAGQLVRPVVESVPALRGGKTNVTRLKPLTTTMMRDIMSRAAIWIRWVKREKIWVPTDPPADVAQIVLSRDGEWYFPRLTGIITTPTMRPDGSILLTPGYDAATGLLLVSPPPMPSIPERPSRDDALAALAMLKAHRQQARARVF